MHTVYYKKLQWLLFRQLDDVIFIFLSYSLIFSYLLTRSYAERKRNLLRALHILEFIFWTCSSVSEFAWTPSHCTLGELIQDWIATLHCYIRRYFALWINFLFDDIQDNIRFLLLNLELIVLRIIRSGDAVASRASCVYPREILSYIFFRKWLLRGYFCYLFSKFSKFYLLYHIKIISEMVCVWTRFPKIISVAIALLFHGGIHTNIWDAWWIIESVTIGATPTLG